MAKTNEAERYYEARTLAYDENNVPYAVEWLYFKAKDTPSKEDVNEYCKEKATNDFEDVVFCEMPANEMLEYVDSLENLDEI